MCNILQINGLICESKLYCIYVCNIEQYGIIDGFKINVYMGKYFCDISANLLSKTLHYICYNGFKFEHYDTYTGWQK